MAKREDRLPPIKHEIRQLQRLKSLSPNTTPVKYAPLSDALVDVAIAALEIVAALEKGAMDEANFGRFYDIVDSLEESLPGHAD